MIPEEFSDYFKNCTSDTQQQIIDMLLKMTINNSQIKDNNGNKAVSCPHCKSSKIRGNGKLKGVQRYFCNNCNKNFSETTGKFWFSLKKKEDINKYLYCLLSGYSIRKSAKYTNITIQTSFNWRHKLLKSFSVISPDAFKGIVESDDMFFLHSEKGNRNLKREPRKRGVRAKKRGISKEQVAVIATCDRSGNKDFRVTTLGRVSKKDIDRAMENRLEKADVLCTDSHRSYTYYAKSKDIKHKKFNASKGQRKVDEIYHVQNVNNMDKRLRSFMDKFNGVATKYLQNYLNWFLVLEKLKNSTQKISSIVTIALTSNTTWFDYKNNLFNIYFRT